MKAQLTQMLQLIQGAPSHGDERPELPAGVGDEVAGAVKLRVGQQMDKTHSSKQSMERIIREKDREIDRLRHALANTEARLQEMMGTDVLTGLPNRHVFKEHFTHSLKRALRLGYSLSIMLVDIDHLRDINLRHGHEVGDAVLVEVAKILRSSVREIDMPARWGGEELVAVLHETDTDGACAVAERVRRRVAMIDLKDERTGKLLAPTASLAVASYPKLPGDPQSLLEAVSEAMITAKEQGGNVVVVATS
jgi:diguanylate cyclase